MNFTRVIISFTQMGKRIFYFFFAKIDFFPLFILLKMTDAKIETAVEDEDKTFDCPICIETVPEYRTVQCTKCKYACCRDCVQNFQLGQTLTAPICINTECVVEVKDEENADANEEKKTTKKKRFERTRWDFSFLAMNTDTKFYKEIYLNHIAKVMFEEEKAQLGEYQARAAVQLVERGKEKKVKEAEHKLGLICRILIKEFSAHCSLKTDRAKKAFEKGEIFLRRMRGLPDTPTAAELAQPTEPTEEQKAAEEEEKKAKAEKNRQAKENRTICPCPRGDCRGFVNGLHVCGLCKKKVCSHCYKVAHVDDEKCDPNDVETIKMLKNECQICPKCATSIYRISGCDVMFCTNCHTSFDWNTGQTITKNIHNPHYFEWLSKQGQLGNVDDMGNIRERIQDQVQGDNLGCNGTVDDWEFRRKLANHPLMSEMLDILQFTRHIQQTEVRVFTKRAQGRDMDRIRVEYLLGDFDEKKYQSLLKAKFKANEKCNSIANGLGAYCNTVLILCDNICQGADINTTYKQIVSMRDYISEIFDDIRRIYGGVAPKILEEISTKKPKGSKWQMVTTDK